MKTLQYTDIAAAPWSHLTIPQRMARIIERRRFLLDGTVTERDFHAEPETCDLSLDELRGNIGKAQQLIEAKAPEPTYDRQTRVRLAIPGMLAFLPSRDDLIDRLKTQGIPAAEAADLLPDILASAAPKFVADRTRGPGAPAFAYETLAHQAG